MSRGMLAVAAVVIALFLGSVLYWQADGAVGTPEDFRQRVAATGLEVEWRNAGPRGGDGLAATECGRVEVSVAEIDGVLWLTVSDVRRLLTGSVVESVKSCSGG